MAHGPHQDVVAKAQADLRASGMDLSGDCGAWKVINLAAWRLTEEGAGLLAKSAGSGCVQNGQLYAKDAIVYQNGEVYDCLIASGLKGGNGDPAWNQDANRDDLPANWRPPLDPSFYFTPTAPAPMPTPAPAPTVDFGPLMARLDQVESELSALTAILNGLASWQQNVGQPFAAQTGPRLDALEAKKVPTGVQAAIQIFGQTVPIHAALTY